MIQTLFFIRVFRNAVYKLPTKKKISLDDNSDEKDQSIPFCLQRIFYNLQNEGFTHKPVRTHELLQAFGWTNNERYQQQDIGEFNCKLRDALESQVENTEVKGTYKYLFEGTLQTVVKCINVDYESTRDEKFSTLQLNVKGNTTIQDSIR